MKKNVVVFCVCQGDCPLYKNIDLFETVRKIRKSNLAYFATINLKLCENDGLNYLETLIKSGNIDNIIVSGCSAENQNINFHAFLKKNRFDLKNFHSIEVKGKNTKTLYEAIKKVLLKLK